MPCFSYSSNDPVYIEPQTSLWTIERVYTVSGSSYSYSNIARLCEIPAQDQLCVYTVTGTTETKKTLNADYTVSTGTGNENVVFNAGVLTGVNQVIIRRCTPNSKLLTQFTEGAKLSAKQLNLVTHQLLFIAQEKQFKDAVINHNYPLSAVINVWTNNIAYSVGQYVKVTSTGTSVYQCIAAHTSNTATNQPGTGTNWTDVWTLVEFITRGFNIIGSPSVPVTFDFTGLTSGMSLSWNGSKFVGQVLNPVIPSNSITSSQLSSTVNNEAVGTGNIKTEAVTTPKIAPLAITTAKYANNSITGIKIIDETITSSKLANNISPKRLEGWGTFTPRYIQTWWPQDNAPFQRAEIVPRAGYTDSIYYNQFGRFYTFGSDTDKMFSLYWGRLNIKGADTQGSVINPSELYAFRFMTNNTSLPSQLQISGLPAFRNDGWGYPFNVCYAVHWPNSFTGYDQRPTDSTPSPHPNWLNGIYRNFTGKTTPGYAAPFQCSVNHWNSIPVGGYTTVTAAGAGTECNVLLHYASRNNYSVNYSHITNQVSNVFDGSTGYAPYTGPGGNWLPGDVANHGWIPSTALLNIYSGAYQCEIIFWGIAPGGTP